MKLALSVALVEQREASARDAATNVQRCKTTTPRRRNDDRSR